MTTTTVIAEAAPVPLEPAPAAIMPKATRLVSLDALRGFDMFWIIGAEDVVHSVDAALQHSNKYASLAAYQMDHSDWIGFRFYDLIFPMFVFIVGVSLVFSLGKLIATRGRAAAVRRVIIRGVVLYLFGVLYYGGLGWAFNGRWKHPDPTLVTGAFHRILHDIRFMGVLQRIAIGYLVAGLLFCYFRPRTLLGVTIGLLALYWGLMSFVPAPGVGHVSFDEGKNLANWIDAKFLPGYKWDDLDHDPEGLLSTMPAIASCLLGVFAGLLLKAGKPGPYLKALILIAAGAAGVALGTAWGYQFPVIKKLWTSSFVLVAGGYSALLLGLFYLIIDVWKIRFWTAPFLWIGMNAITLYLIWHIVEFQKLAALFVGSESSEFGKHVFHGWADVVNSALALVFILIIARFLYKRQIFLRV